MLERITLRNFRQFEDRTITFNAGTTALRGRNEGGKSTIVEAFLYAVGGAKRCRNGDFVRWGAKQSECRVEALLRLQGQPVRVTRGPRGAEVYVGSDTKPAVTGQKEVTNWFANQFGASLDVVMKMAFAKQDDLRGLLDDKNGKVMEFIEEMSGLDIVDFIIQQITATGATGSTAAIEDQTLAAREQLENERKVSYAAAIESVETRLVPMVETQKVVEQQVNDLKTGVRATRAALNALQMWAASAAAAERSERAAALALSEAHVELEARTSHLRELTAATTGLAEEREQLVARQESAKKFAEQRRAWDAFQRWKPAEIEWDEGEPALKAAIAKLRAEYAEHQKKIRASDESIHPMHREIAKLEATIVASSACGLCGKDVSEFPEVRENNARVQARIAELREAVEAARVTSKVLETEGLPLLEDISLHESILEAPRFTSTAARYAGLFELDERYVPPRVKWIGPDVSGDAPADPAARIEEIDRALKRAQRQQQEVETAQALVKSAQAHVERMKQELKDVMAGKPEGDEKALVAKIEKDEAAMDAARIDATTRAGEIGSLMGRLTELRAGETRHAALIERLEKQVTDGEAVLARYVFNNTLIDDLRRARPVVANALWNQILKAVSSYLTKMRGEPSIVTRDGSVFMVNGKPFSSYSGSALDLLALGLRSALTKVFVPGINMQVLDEPFAACDETRTNQCLAFLSGAGFAQTIVITHESTSEQCFEHLIEVTE